MDEPSNFLCPLCDNKDLKTMENLQRHHLEVHAEETNEEPVDFRPSGEVMSVGDPRGDVVC